jgi:iron complex outermembrane receptor protein
MKALYNRGKFTKMKTNKISLFAFAFFLTSSLTAQTDNNTLKDVVVQENRLHIKDIFKSSVLLKYDSAKLLPHKSVSDLLSSIAGVDVRQRGPVGIQADISIRGGSFDQTQILLNGLKMNDPQTGHHNMNLALPAEAIKEMLVVKNSAARKYGINVYSGYVNIITQVPQNNMVFAGISGGQYGLRSYNAGAAWHHKNWGQMIALKQSACDCYTTNSDFDTKEIFYQTELKSKANQLDVMAGYSERNFGARGFYVPNSTEYETTKSAFLGFKDTYKLAHWKIISQGYWRNHDDHYIYLRSKPDIYQNQHYTNTLGLEVHATNTNKFGVSGIGVDFRNEAIRSYNYSGAVRSEQLGIRERNIKGFFAEHQFSFLQNRVQFTPGIYANLLNENQVDFFPGFDAQYIINPNFTAFATLDNAMRFPTFTDLYYRGPANIGNSNLTLEKTTNSEIGLHYKKGKFTSSLSYFNRYSNNTIDWARTSDTLKWQPLNVNHVQTDGLEFGSAYLGKGIINKISLDYTYIDMKLLQTESYKSYYTLTNLKHQLIVKAMIKLPQNLILTISFKHIERVNMADYQLLDSRLTWLYKSFSAYVDASNILDKSYIETGYCTNAWPMVKCRCSI